MSAYTHFRYIAYQVPTVGWSGANYLEMPLGNALGLPRYTGAGGIPAAITNITNLDARNRVARFYDVLERARAQVTAPMMGDDKYTLKIFMAPEFYFRPTTAGSTTVPQGPSYTYQEYKEIKTALRTLINKSDFINWLVIPGTIMWSGSGIIGKRPTTGGDTVYFNTALYMKVGNVKFGSQVIEKEQSSHIDGLPTGRHSRVGPPSPTDKATDEIWTIYQTTAKRRKHIFEHYGTHCGIEVCLEHGRAVLKDILSDTANWTEGLSRIRKSISLQLIPAGGMTITNGNVAVKNNGYIMRTDGLGNNTVPPQTEIYQVTGYGNKDFGISVPVSYGYKPSYAQYGGPVAVQNTIHLNGVVAGLEVPDPGCTGGYFFNQDIIIYQRQALP
jgi:hypothetical protein